MLWRGERGGEVGSCIGVHIATVAVVVIQVEDAYGGHKRVTWSGGGSDGV